MQISCPHCSTALDVTQEHLGHQVQCPACQNRLTVPTEVASADHGSGPKHPERMGWEEGDHANVSFGKSLLFGVLITVAFLGLMFPFLGTRLGDLFLDRGWVNWMETFLFCWGLVILMMKWRKNQSQERATLLNLFPEHLGREIHVGNVGGFIDNIYNVSPKPKESVVVQPRGVLEGGADIIFFVECNSTGIVLLDPPGGKKKISTAAIKTSGVFAKYLDKVKKTEDAMVLFLIRKAGNDAYRWAAGAAEIKYKLATGKLPIPNDGEIDLSLFKK